MDSGADFTLRDERGYTALNYAVLNGDPAMEKVVLKGLRRTIDRDDAERLLPQLLAEAKLRKGYRELFQEKLQHAYVDAITGDGIVKSFLRDPNGPSQKKPFITFFSYSCINKKAGATSPDDENHT
ncbi:hypothetical protein F5X99DRAFT_320991 [Biscogniauxia marginata]|nr:hypothetical protein F5X99DRAFT_320991 [Biscogniauxia marginata]